LVYSNNFLFNYSLIPLNNIKFLFREQSSRTEQGKYYYLRKCH